MNQGAVVMAVAFLAWSVGAGVYNRQLKPFLWTYFTFVLPLMLWVGACASEGYEQAVLHVVSLGIGATIPAWAKVSGLR